MINFNQSIESLQKIRKFVDKQAINCEDYPFISLLLEEVSLELTLAINDLVRINRAGKNIKQKDYKEITNDCNNKETNTIK